MKKCFKCGDEKELNCFYKHYKMKDGHLNKCKECAKKDVNKNRFENIDYYREFDRKRGSRKTKEQIASYRARFPRKYAAHAAVGNSVRIGVLVAQPCEKCGSTYAIQAHHDDYLRQLDIRWLCSPCHKQWHIENGEGKNGV